MFSAHQLTLRLPQSERPLLENISAVFPAGKLCAVVGPSGCGKTTLIKVLLGLLRPSAGEVSFAGERVFNAEDLTGRTGFAPQFSIAPEELSVAEALHYALQLYGQERRGRMEEILETVGLPDRADTFVKRLSGGQQRRLGLALELAGDPRCLIADEVTSGLDPDSEQRILDVLERLVTAQGKTVICVIHNLGALDRFEHITVMNAGRVAFQGDLEALRKRALLGEDGSLLELYARMDRLEASGRRDDGRPDRQASGKQQKLAEPDVTAVPPASGLTQFRIHLSRRFKLFVRDRAHLGLTAAITLGFPCLVVIFALGGLPEIEWLALDAPLGVAESLRERMRLTVDALEAASLVNGLILFQIVLITLMGSNNGAREIAGQRAYYEKERLNGLRPASFWAAESLFVAGLGALQGLWMALFVKFVCGFPGPLLPQGACLAAIGAAMSLICLGFSAHARSPERASLVSIYWVGFQLPLSGIVLALPVALEWICRPVISAYWAWGGYLHSMRASRYFDAFRLTSREWLPDSAVALLVLGVHALVGAFLAWMGCRRRFWDG